MTKTKAIRKYCLECVGEGAKDVAFCTAPGCVLWEHRLGTDLRSVKGIEMMRRNCEGYEKDFADLEEKYGVDPSLYLPRTPRRIGQTTFNKGIEAIKRRQKERVGSRVATR